MVKIFPYPNFYTVHINEQTGEVKIYSSSKTKKGGKMSPYVHRNGYLRLRLNGNHTYIHFLVAHFYHGERPKGYVIDHKDGNKLNNRPDNLRYVTQSINVSSWWQQRKAA